MTNVKAGDLAIVKSNKPCYDGRIFQVLYRAPAHEFVLPDGYRQMPPIHHPAWVLKAVGGPTTAPMEGGGRRLTWYGVGADECLRPLPGEPEEEDVSEKLPVMASAPRDE